MCRPRPLNQHQEVKKLTLHLREPLGLPVMLRGAGNRVEEHQQEHQPVEVGGLDGHAAVLPHGVIELTQLVAKKKKVKVLLS